jgi:hypothetical protein
MPIHHATHKMRMNQKVMQPQLQQYRTIEDHQVDMNKPVAPFLLKRETLATVGIIPHLPSMTYYQREISTKSVRASRLNTFEDGTPRTGIAGELAFSSMMNNNPFDEHIQELIKVNQKNSNDQEALLRDISAGIKRMSPEEERSRVSDMTRAIGELGRMEGAEKAVGGSDVPKMSNEDLIDRGDIVTAKIKEFKDEITELGGDFGEVDVKKMKNLDEYQDELDDIIKELQRRIRVDEGKRKNKDKIAEVEARRKDIKELKKVQAELKEFLNMGTSALNSRRASMTTEALEQDVKGIIDTLDLKIEDDEVDEVVDALASGDPLKGEEQEKVQITLDFADLAEIVRNWADESDKIVREALSSGRKRSLPLLSVAPDVIEKAESIPELSDKASRLKSAIKLAKSSSVDYEDVSRIAKEVINEMSNEMGISPLSSPSPRRKPKKSTSPVRRISELEKQVEETESESKEETATSLVGKIYIEKNIPLSVMGYKSSSNRDHLKNVVDGFFSPEFYENLTIDEFEKQAQKFVKVFKEPSKNSKSADEFNKVQDLIKKVRTNKKLPDADELKEIQFVDKPTTRSAKIRKSSG